MSIGLILLIIVAILIAFGIAQRVLDRMRLTDRQALFFVLLLFVGGLIPDIPLGNFVRINIGGALVPIGIAVYLLIRAGSAKEVIRTLAASLLTAAAIYLLVVLSPINRKPLSWILIIYMDWLPDVSHICSDARDAVHLSPVF